MILLFFFPLLSLAQLKCIVNNTDYSSLTKTDEYYQLLTPTYIFTVNVCGTVNDEDDVAVTQPSRQVKTYSLGKYSTQQPIEDENGVGFTYTEGYQDGKYQWKSNIYFKCDETLKDDSVYILNSNQETKVINFIIKGPNFCIESLPIENESFQCESNQNNSTDCLWITSILLPIVLVIIFVCIVAILIVFVIKRKRTEDNKMDCNDEDALLPDKQNEDIYQT